MRKGKAVFAVIELCKPQEHGFVFDGIKHLQGFFKYFGLAGHQKDFQYVEDVGGIKQGLLLVILLK